MVTGNVKHTKIQMVVSHFSFLSLFVGEDHAVYGHHYCLIITFSGKISCSLMLMGYQSMHLSRKVQFNMRKHDPHLFSLSNSNPGAQELSLFLLYLFRYLQDNQVYVDLRVA